MFLFEILGAWDISKFFNPPIFTIVPCNEILINNFYTFWSSFCPARFFRVNQVDKKVIMRFIEVLRSSLVIPIQVQSLECLDDFGLTSKNDWNSSVPVHDNLNFQTWPDQVTNQRHLPSILAHKPWFQFFHRLIWWTFACFVLCSLWSSFDCS